MEHAAPARPSQPGIQDGDGAAGSIAAEQCPNRISHNRHRLSHRHGADEGTPPMIENDIDDPERVIAGTAEAIHAATAPAMG